MDIDKAIDNAFSPSDTTTLPPVLQSVIEDVIQKKKRSKTTLTTAVENHTTSVNEKLTYLADLVIQLASRLEALEKRLNDTDRIDLVYGKVHEIEDLLRNVRSN